MATTASVQVKTAIGTFEIKDFPLSDAALYLLGEVQHLEHFTDAETQTLWAAAHILARGKGLPHILAVTNGVRGDEIAQ